MNLVDAAEYAGILAELRQELANEMYVTHDPMLQGFEEAFGIRGLEIVIGCMDTTASNYAPRANRHDHTLCQLESR